jgi:hypothetical protein
MDILHLCCFSNKYSIKAKVKCIDFSLGTDVFRLPNDYGSIFNFILAAPPCDQFTKANSWKWLDWPEFHINIALKCFVICIKSGKPWILENPPGRIEKLIPELKPFRRITLSDQETNKEWVLYSNLPLTRPNNKRYGKMSMNNYGKIKRNEYPKYFYEYLETQFNLFGLLPGQHLDLSSGQKPGLYQELNQALNSGVNPAQIDGNPLGLSGVRNRDNLE